MNTLKSFILTNLAMKSYSKMILIIFALFLVLSLAQRGGSRSSSESSSSQSHSYSSSRYRNRDRYYADNCTTVNGVTTCTYEEQSLTSFFVILGIAIVLSVFAIRAAAKEEQKRKTVIDAAMKQFEMRMEEFTSPLSSEERNKLIDEFMKMSYTIVVQIKDKSQKFFCQVKVTDLKKENQNKYTIKMTGSDEVGKSKFEGLLLFKNSGLGIKLSKVYDDRKKAEQTGSFDVLLYEGEGMPEKMTGQWAFHGHQTSQEYSGSWQMMQI